MIDGYIFMMDDFTYYIVRFDMYVIISLKKKSLLIVIIELYVIQTTLTLFKFFL